MKKPAKRVIYTLHTVEFNGLRGSKRLPIGTSQKKAESIRAKAGRDAKVKQATLTEKWEN